MVKPLRPVPQVKWEVNSMKRWGFGVRKMDGRQVLTTQQREAIEQLVLTCKALILSKLHDLSNNSIKQKPNWKVQMKCSWRPSPGTILLAICYMALCLTTLP